MFGERQFCNFKKWDAQNAWGVQKMHRNFHTFENHRKTIWKCMTFCNRVPVQGVLQKSNFASWHTWRALFFVLPAMRGDHVLYKFRKSQLILGLGRGGAPNPFSCQVRFSRPPLRKCTLFLLDDSSAGMGTTFFIKIMKIHLALQIPIWKRSRGQNLIAFWNKNSFYITK